MKNQDIADIFSQMADLMELLGEDRFRVNSYRKAARIVGELTEPIEEVAAANRLEGVPGIGKSTAEKIRQYLQTGKITRHQELLGRVPPGLPALLGVSGLGPKTVAKLWKQAEVVDLETLKAALADPRRIERVEGMGPKKARQILESLAFMAGSAGRSRLDEAEALAESLIAAVKQSKGVRRAMAAGSLRRASETVGDIDLLCEASASAAEGIIEKFTSAQSVQRVLAKGPTKGSVVLAGGVQADLRVVGGKSFGAALMYFTGSKEHNVRLRERALKQKLKLNEYGLFKGDKQIAGEGEEETFKALGLAFVPPEMREDRGEVEAAAKDALPKLVDLRDIRGDLHMHTVASDGLSTIEEMIGACRRRGYKYLAICDHSKSQIQAHGLDEQRLAEHAEAIRKAAGERFPDMLALVGIEVDIFRTGGWTSGRTCWASWIS